MRCLPLLPFLPSPTFSLCPSPSQTNTLTTLLFHTLLLLCARARADRFWGEKENAREVAKDFNEMRARIRQNLPLYGHTRLSEYNQAVAFKNSYRSADKLCAFPDLPFCLFLACPCSARQPALSRREELMFLLTVGLLLSSRVHALVRPPPTPFSQLYAVSLSLCQLTSITPLAIRKRQVQLCQSQVPQHGPGLLPRTRERPAERLPGVLYDVRLSVAKGGAFRRGRRWEEARSGGVGLGEE